MIQLNMTVFIMITDCEEILRYCHYCDTWLLNRILARAARDYRMVDILDSMFSIELVLFLVAAYVIFRQKDCLYCEEALCAFEVNVKLMQYLSVWLLSIDYKNKCHLLKESNEVGQLFVTFYLNTKTYAMTYESLVTIYQHETFYTILRLRRNSAICYSLM